MNLNVFIFHGTGGHPGENWFPWLKEKLEANGLKVIVPQFPTPEGQSLDSWLKVFEQHQPKINEQTILIAHSLGNIFLFRLLERLKQPVKLAVFVAAPIGIKPIKNYEGDFNFSNGFDFDWQKIKSNSKNFIVYHSVDDPNMGFENGKELAKHLEVNLTSIPNAGHFNEKAGYTKFEDLLTKLEKYL